jgi:hypothetical protein
VRTLRILAVVLLGISSSIVVAGQSSPDDQTAESIRRSLERLPYYGVFDLLQFTYERGTVALSGFAYAPGLESSAIATLKRVPRVDTVESKVMLLSASPSDDRIRWSAFYRIYADDSLARYAPGGGLTRFERPFGFARFPATQPLGHYAVHIVVNRGHIRLEGIVDSEADKTVAWLRAREVTGTFGVDNAIVVADRGTR